MPGRKTISVPPVNKPIVEDDKSGTVQMIRFFEDIVRKLEEIELRIKALEP